ncbi:HIT family protein [Silvibacterium dinghuense]|uniref:HIT domain-containing protein n=1 Tax=Silvibacterium dinghuense TaxID=1560006 RepID=A0A4Q1SJG9_9BACT|nr:HIT domain-containing protein [Silvibacterium dinghuense]RXS97420.1 HIT domain-containing protein [Silvibacterium dinghuense]
MDHLWTPWRYAYVTDDRKSGRKGVPPELEAWPEDRGCVFCNLLAAADYGIAQGMPPEEADRAALIVHRAEHNYVCLNRYPYSSGHLMVVPHQHGSSFAALNSATAQELTALAQQAERALTESYRPHGINMGLNLGQAAGAGVAEHLHLHALPRWVGDTNFMTAVAETRILPETLEVTWARLREAFVKTSATE